MTPNIEITRAVRSGRDIAAAPHGRRSVIVAAGILGFALALGGCSKCDVPTWQPRPAGPQSCHDGPSQ